MSAASGVAAAAAPRKREQQEEEEVTSYNPQDLAEDWEFKILRSSAGAFRNPERLRAILKEEEQRGGWLLVEKFDNNRIGLKRPAGIKVVAEELASGYDPYRTTVDLSDRMIAPLILGPCFAVALILMLVIS